MQTFHISELALYLEADGPEAYSGISWAELDDTASVIPYLKTVTVCFKDDKHMARLAEVRLAERLKRLSETNKLRLIDNWP